jgi:ribonuclease P/MRP protein subunit RPP1
MSKINLFKQMFPSNNMKPIKETSIEKAKNQVKKLVKQKEKPIIVQAQNDSFNRKILEYGKFDILLSIESGKRKDKLRQLDSGLNHVLAKIATKNKISIGIDLEEISQLQKTQKAKRLAKIKQNIKICHKAKTKLTIVDYQDSKNAQNLLLTLGASTKQAKEAISF